MSSEVYAQAADLKKHFARIDEYDLKNKLSDYKFVQHSGNTWKLQDSGSVVVLYLNGEDQGSAVANVGALSNDYDWVYVTSEDCLYILFATGDTPTDNSWRIEAAPQDWDDAKTDAIKYASEMMESILDDRFPRPIPKTTSSKVSGVEYDYWVVMCTSLLAAWHLVKATDPGGEDHQNLTDQLGTPIGAENPGLLDKINNGDIKLSFELTDSDGAQIEEVSVNASSTGFPTEPIGEASVEYEAYIIEIVAGGTITNGTANTSVSYKVTNSQGETVVSTTIIDGNYYHEIGAGIKARFVAEEAGSVYTTGDKWVLIAQNEGINTSTIGSAEIVRK